MAILSPKAVRQRIAAAVEALSGWREAKAHSYDTFPGESSQAAHLGFAVGVPSTTFTSGVESSRVRRGAIEGGLVRTEVRVRWTHRTRADGQVDDYDAALDAETTLITTILGVARTDLHVELEGATRGVAGDGTYMLGEVAVVATHRIALE